jgi:uncharacterized membrane protein
MFKAITMGRFFFLIFISYVVINFIILVGYKEIFGLLHFKPAGYSHYYFSNLLFILPYAIIFLGIAGLFYLYASIAASFNKDTTTSLFYSSLVLSPVILLSLWRSAEGYSPFFIPLCVVLMASLTFYFLLSRQKENLKINPDGEKLIIFIVAILYIAFFLIVAIKKYYSFSFFNSKDFAIYNQTFWNTVHGRIFHNSMYGSNFACHNSPFFFFLVPFYYIFPHPLTLIFLKIFLLTLAVIPFYLIAKETLPESSPVWMTLAFLFFPFIVSLNILPPHEIAYAPFFILFTYYFFLKNRFLPFLLFLLIMLSVKEHLALIAVMFGLLAYIRKKGPVWIWVPIALGIFWALFSFWLIRHFQQIYSSHPDAAWLMVNLKKRFLNNDGNIFLSILGFLINSNLTSLYSLQWIVTFFLFLGIVPPFLSPVSLLALPEFSISLLSNNLAMFTIPWHYNVTVSCFLLIATLEGIRKIARWKWFKDRKISINAATNLLCVLILCIALINSYLWLEFTQSFGNKEYVRIVTKAISCVPKDAFLTVPRHLAVQVSSREKYSILDSKDSGNYILLDKNNQGFMPRKELDKSYRRVFYEDGVEVLQKIDKD